MMLKPSDSNRPTTVGLPQLDRGHRDLAPGQNGTVARIIPESGAEDDTWFVEFYSHNGNKGPCQSYLPRGTFSQHVEQFLAVAGFGLAGEWDKRPHDGKDPDYATCLGWDRHGKRLTGSWHLDGEIEQLMFCSVLAGQRHRRED